MEIREVIIALLVGILISMLNIYFQVVSQEIVLVVILLSVISLFTFLTFSYFQRLLGSKIICPVCKGKGKVKCSNSTCQKGYLNPKIGINYGVASSFIRRGNDVFLRINSLTLNNSGVLGKVKPIFKICSKVDNIHLGKKDFDSIKIASCSKKVIGPFEIKLNKFKRLKKILGREPDLRDINIGASAFPIGQGKKCTICGGTGFVQCPRCKGKRVSFL